MLLELKEDIFPESGEKKLKNNRHACGIVTTLLVRKIPRWRRAKVQRRRIPRELLGSKLVVEPGAGGWFREREQLVNLKKTLTREDYT